jgi:hypothetical protein
MAKVFGHIQLKSEGMALVGTTSPGPFPIIDHDPHFGVEILDHNRQSHWIMTGQFNHLEENTIHQETYEKACGQNRHVQDVQSQINNIKQIVELHGRDGNWNVSEYMGGLYNGMELILATLEHRDPEFRKIEPTVDPLQGKKDALFSRVLKWQYENDIQCSETIHQTDRVITNAYEFMDDLFEIIEPLIEKTDDDDE